MNDTVYIIAAMAPESLVFCGEVAMFYKIGISNNPLKRLSQLQTSCPLKLVLLHYWNIPYPFKPDQPTARDIEASLHKHLASHKIRGEWFDTWAVNALHDVIQSDDVNALIKFCGGY